MYQRPLRHASTEWKDSPKSARDRERLWFDLGGKLTHLDLAVELRDLFTAIYPELGDTQGERIRRAIKESFAEKGWEDAHKMTEQLDKPEFKRFLEILRSDPKPDLGLRTLLSRPDELEDYGFFGVDEAAGTLCANESPTVIRIHTTQNENLQRAFASLVSCVHH